MGGNKSTTAKVDRRSGDLTLQQHETDSPILPLAHIERLQQFRPDIVDFIVAETGKEAADRRDETRKHNTRVFIERMLGQVLAAGMFCAAIYAAYELAMAGHDKVAAIVGTTAAIGIATALLIHRRR